MGARTIVWLESVVAGWSEGFVRACWQGGLFILVVWLVCRLFTRLPAAARHWLWWLACLKLIFSLFWATPFDLPILPMSATQKVAVGPRFELPTPPIEIGDAAVHWPSGSEAPRSSL